MKKFFVFSILLALVLSGCGKKAESIKLEKDTPAYQLAKDLSNKLPYLDPDKNNNLISTKGFDISTGEVIQSIYNNTGSRSSQLRNIDTNRLKTIILQNAERLTEQKLVLNEAKKAKFSLSQTLLDSIIENQYSRSGGEQKFLEMLKMSNVSIENVKDEIRKSVIFNQYLDETLGQEIQITEEEIQNAYNDYTNKEIATIRHILLLTQGKSDAEKREIRNNMEKILAEARKGEDFSELVKKYSEDPGSKNNGGLYENFTRGVMVKPFEDAAFSVPVGEISNIIETVYGYHILKVIARNNFKSLEEYRPELESQIKGEKKPQIYRAYIDKLKEKKEYTKIDF